MSYVALITDRFDEVVKFYGERLRFPIVDRWDRSNARGLRFDLGGMKLEILDNSRERKSLSLGDPADRVHVVIEVDDIDEARRDIDIDAPPPQSTSWGARLFQIRDPDGVPVTYLQWISKIQLPDETIRGRLTSGVGQGKFFTHIDWARRQFIDKLSIDPFPGTVNLMIEEPDSMSAWDQVRNTQGVRIDNPNSSPDACSARCYPVSIDGRLDAAIVLPEVAGYSSNQIEFIAPVSVRGALGFNDGDSVILEVKSP